MNIVLPNRFEALMVLSTVGCVIQGCSRRERQSGACAGFTRKGTWDVAMKSESAVYTLEGTLETTDRAVRVRLIGVSREGTREPLEYDAESLIVTGDSISFRFAPLGIRVDGWCVTPDSIASHVSVPQPPFGPIVGSGVIHKRG